MAGGFYKVPHEVHRALSGDPNTFRVFCELASRARWAAGAYLGSHGIVELAIGQCAIGRAELAADLGLTERAVRTALDRLSRLRAVAVETSKRGTVVTVHEYSANAEQAPSERPSTDAPIDQAPVGQTTISATTSEETRRTEGKKKRERRSAASALPDTWKPRDEDNRLADQQLEHELANFRDYAKSNDWRKQDWDATWRVWQRKAAAFAPNSRRPPIARGSEPPANHFGDELRVPRRESGLDAVLRIAREGT